MTTTVTSLATGALTLNSYDSLSTSIGLAVIGLLAVLLLLREFAPMLRDDGASARTRALDMAIVPLLIVFAIIVLARLAELLR
ncbi:MAG TPA: hypothetical protein VF344_01495 [Candidatus Limnocylindrales bacterium]|jgi:hypothetical protein